MSVAFLQPTRHKLIALKGALTVFISEKIKSLDLNQEVISINFLNGTTCSLLIQVNLRTNEL